IKIGGQDLPPLLWRHFDRSTAMGDAGIVDEDRHSAEGFLGGIEGACHCRAVGNVRLDSKSAASLIFDLAFQRFEPLGPPCHQYNSGAIVRECSSELRAQPTRSAGH